MSENQTTKYYKCIDVEAINDTDINGIGLVVADQDGDIVHKKSYWWMYDIFKMDGRCRRDFWEKNPGPYQVAQKAQAEESDKIIEFVKDYDDIPKGVDEKEVKLVCDNPAFDFAGLTPYVKQHCDRDPLRYTTDGQYRSIKDLGDAMWELGLGKAIDDQVSRVVVHDHYPENDAHHNVLCHIIRERTIAKLKEVMGDKMLEIAKEVAEEFVDNLLHVKRQKIDNHDQVASLPDAPKPSLDPSAVKSKYPVGSFWRHYKGGLYWIKNHVVLKSSGEIIILYQDTLDSRLGWFARREWEWEEEVEWEGETVPRFKQAPATLNPF